MVRITNLSLAFDHSPRDLHQAAARMLGISSKELISLRILRRSLDARKKEPLSRVYSLLVEVIDENVLKNRVELNPDISFASEEKYQIALLRKERLSVKPLIIGTGPAGIFAGLILAEAGCQPILLERGKSVRERTLDTYKFWREGELNSESNVQFGEGGAGTFSDGKLQTRVKDRFNRDKKILEEFVQAGAPPEILYDNKPHIGTAKLVNIVQSFRKKIIQLGGEYKFESRVVDLILSDDAIIGVILANGEEILSPVVVLAVGHSATDTFNLLLDRGVQLSPKPFSVGFRIEHPQILIDRNQYGKHASHPSLGAADYQLAFHSKTGRSVYSFCMCPGGKVIAASSQPGTVVTNGMSQFERSGENANSAIVAEISPDDFGNKPLEGIVFQRKWEKFAFHLGGENYFAPVQLVGDFLANLPSKELGSVSPSYQPGFQLGNLREAFPDYIIAPIREALSFFNQRIPGFVMRDAVLTGVETRTSSPVRILRGKDMQSVSVSGLYPIGEGSGYAGGIMSSALDGIKAAEIIIEAFQEVN